jgi:threonylcarbamoyladenosine tRNA methylthiotransferase MtaB
MAKIVTLGCRLNQYDSARLQKLVEDCAEDIVIINTCTVTGNADIDARKAARKMKRENPNSKVIVFGCAVRGNRGLFEGVKEIDYIVRDEAGLMALLSLEPKTSVIPRFVGRTRAMIKIQEGCDQKCSYCIVPLVRGRSRSRTLSEVEKEFRGLVEAGYKEIVITGTHIADFGKGHKDKMDLPLLLKKLLSTDEDFRIRLSSMEMSGISDELISLIAESAGRIANHLHIPIQSGSPKVLKDMNRNTDIEKLREKIFKLKKEIPGICIGADFINAFPTEGEREFEETVNLIKELPLAFLHIFTFSPRPNTVACQFQPLRKEVADARKKEMMVLAKRKRLDFFKENEEKVLRSLTLENDKGRGKALSGNFIEFSTEKMYEPNRFIDLELKLNKDFEPVGIEVK